MQGEASVFVMGREPPTAIARPRCSSRYFDDLFIKIKNYCEYCVEKLVPELEKVKLAKRVWRRHLSGCHVEQLTETVCHRPSAVHNVISRSMQPGDPLRCTRYMGYLLIRAERRPPKLETGSSSLSGRELA